MIERDPLHSDQSLISPLPAIGTGVPMAGTTVYARIPPASQAAEKSAPWFALQQRPVLPSFVEGLTPGPAGTLYLVDVPWGRVLQVLVGGEARTVLQYDGQPNGLALRPGGGALLADFEHGLLQVDELTSDAEVRPLLTRYGMGRFKGLNDVLVARNGEVYFTDQGGTGLHDPSGRIYCLRPDGELRVVLDGLPSPNALALDEASRVLYVAVTRDNAVWKVPLRADGTTAKVGRYLQLSGGAGPDGLALTMRGWLLVTHLGLGVVWLFDSKGRPVLAYDCPTGDDPSSVTVAPDNRHVLIAEASSGSVLVAALPAEAVGQAMSMTVLMTGASGRIATVLRPALRTRYDGLILLSRDEIHDLDPSERLHVADLGDLDATVDAARGADAIVHLGGIADEAPFDAILHSNIIGTYNVFEAARRQGVKRVLFASSNHVTGFYRCNEDVSVADPPRPDTYYGMSKVFGEALGRLYHDKWGVETTSLRIGSFRAAPEDERQLSTWLSHRDCITLVTRALEARDTGYLTIYGVSANTRSWWRPGAEAERLGWAPVDDAEDFATQLGVAPADATATDQDCRQGGRYVDTDYRGWYL